MKEIVEKEMYLKERECNVCSKNSKLVLPVSYMFRFHDAGTYEYASEYKNLCFQCANKLESEKK